MERFHAATYCRTNQRKSLGPLFVNDSSLLLEQYEVIAEIAYDEESYVPGSRDEFGRFQGGSFVPIPGQSTTLTQTGMLLHICSWTNLTRSTGTVVADTAYNSFGQGDGFSAIRQVCSQLPDNGSSALCVNSNAQLEGVYSTTVAWVPYSTLAEPAATTAPVNAVERYEDSAGGKLTATLAISMVLAILGLLVL